MGSGGAARGAGADRPRRRCFGLQSAALLLVAIAVGCVEPSGGSSPHPSARDTGDTGLVGDSADSGDSAAAPEFDETVDVVVIGGGVAGLAAASEAGASGARVVLFEREATFGGAASLSGGLMLFSGSSEQTAAGIVDSPTQLAAEWPAFTGGDVANPWFLTFASENVPRVHDWLATLGVRWDQPGGDESSGTTERVHPVAGGGPALVSAMLSAVPTEALRASSTVSALVQHRGRVVGVTWSDDAGEHSMGAGSVVVTTGGFLRDLARVEAAVPELALTQVTFASAPGADGNGHTMLEALGAGSENLQAIGFYAHGVPSPANPREEIGAREIGEFPWVNLSAARFADETGLNSFLVGRTRAFQPEGLVWLVGDARLTDTEFVVLDGGRDSYDVEELCAAGVAFRGDALAALATELGLDPTALHETVEEWNAASRGEVVDPFRDADADAVRPVSTAPFYAVPVATSLAKNFGGIAVDLNGRVLDAAGQPLPGVYAAGELTGMCGGSIVGDYGFTGSLSCVVLGGRVAGEGAAVEALSLR